MPPASPSPSRNLNLLTNLVLVLPLLAIYEIGILFSDNLNGADFITTTLLQVVGKKGFIWAQFGLITLIVALTAYLRSKEELKLKQIVPVLIESLIYALVMGTLIIIIMVHILGINPRLAANSPQSFSAFQKILISVGAGFHEELLFRLVIFGGLLYLLKRMPWIKKAFIQLILSLLISSILFSAAHHIGSYADPFTVGVFTYRFLAGIFFGLIFRFRSFAIAVYTHTFYDLYVLFLG